MRTVQRSLEVGDVDSITTVAGGACTGNETGTGTGAGAGAHAGAAGGAARSMRDPSPIRRPCGAAWGAAAVAAVAVGVAAVAPAECGDGCVASCCLQAWGLTRKVFSVVSWQPWGNTTNKSRQIRNKHELYLDEAADPDYGVSAVLRCRRRAHSSISSLTMCAQRQQFTSRCLQCYNVI